MFYDKAEHYWTLIDKLMIYLISTDIYWKKEIFPLTIDPSLHLFLIEIKNYANKLPSAKKKTKRRKALQVPLSKHNKNQCDFILIRDMAKSIFFCVFIAKNSICLPYTLDNQITRSSLSKYNHRIGQVKAWFSSATMPTKIWKGAQENIEFATTLKRCKLLLKFKPVPSNGR